ncbi:hypothetical protein CPC08DRAFT_596561, partial [Agrocybe pediades]
ELTDEELELIRAFTLKTEDHLSNRTFERMRYTFKGNSVGTLKAVKSRIQWLAKFKPVAYDCCIKSCCCFVGPLANDDKCAYCGEARWDENGKARKRFNYMPIIPRLSNAFRNVGMVQKMQYRGEFTRSEESIHDVFDSASYAKLTTEHVTIPGEPPLPHKYFQDSRDIALGLSTDGFSPFKRRKHTC